MCRNPTARANCWRKFGNIWRDVTLGSDGLLQCMSPPTEREKVALKQLFSIPNSSYGWMSGVSPLDAFMSVKMGTFREFQLYMVWLQI